MIDYQREIYSILENMGNAERKNREAAARRIRNDMALFPALLNSVFETENKIHHKAAWILEIVLERDMTLIVPYLSPFCDGLHRIENESALRPLSKICYWISREYVTGRDPRFVQKLTFKDIQKIVESNFDWLIGNHKIATQAFAMDTLFLFGQLPEEEYAWIHTELQAVISQNMASKSPGYRQRAKKILHLLIREKQ